MNTGYGRGAIIGTGTPVEPIPIAEMNKYSCLSPESKAIYDQYVQTLIDKYNEQANKR